MRVTTEEMSRRKEHLLKVGALMMGRHGIDRVSQNDLAAEAGVAHGNIQNYLGTYEGMKAAVVEYCRYEQYPQVLVQAVGHPVFKHQLAKKDIQLAIRHLKV